MTTSGGAGAFRVAIHGQGVQIVEELRRLVEERLWTEMAPSSAMSASTFDRAEGLPWAKRGSTWTPQSRRPWSGCEPLSAHSSNARDPQ